MSISNKLISLFDAQLHPGLPLALALASRDVLDLLPPHYVSLLLLGLPL